MSVKRVTISESEGTIQDPHDAKVKRNVDTILWELAGEGELRITFKESPFGDPGQQPTCRGRSCEVLQPPRDGSEKPATDGHEGRVYKYTIQVKRGGRTFSLDPNVEVIP